MKIAANLEMLGQGQIKFFRPEVLAADPAGASLFEARGWWNTTEKVLKFFDGTKVIEIAIGGDLNDYVRHDGTVAMTNDLLLSSADQYSILSQKQGQNSLEVLLRKSNDVSNAELLMSILKQNEIIAFTEELPSMNEIFINTVAGKNKPQI
jgi:ABC-type uncharacterized transport system ATPase subunit